MMVDDNLVGLEVPKQRAEISELVPCTRVEHDSHLRIAPALIRLRKLHDLGFGIQESVTFRHGAGNYELDFLALSRESIGQSLHRTKAVAVGTNMSRE